MGRSGGAFSLPYTQALNEQNAFLSYLNMRYRHLNKLNMYFNQIH